MGNICHEGRGFGAGTLTLIRAALLSLLYTDVVNLCRRERGSGVAHQFEHLLVSSFCLPAVRSSHLFLARLLFFCLIFSGPPFRRCSGFSFCFFLFFSPFFCVAVDCKEERGELRCRTRRIRTRRNWTWVPKMWWPSTNVLLKLLTVRRHFHFALISNLVRIL